MQLSANNITAFLVSIAVMLFFAKLLGEFFIKIKQPAIIGEILAGIILGPTVFGMIMPDTFHFLFRADSSHKIALDGITNLAVIMLLLVSGLEVDLKIILKQGKSTFITGLMGILIPFILGFGIVLIAPGLFGASNNGNLYILALFLGTALSISALPVIAKTLMDLNIFKTEIGFVIIAAAMFDDLVGWLVFSVILGLIGSNVSGISFYETLFFVIFFALIMLTAGKKLINRLIPVIQNKFSFPGSILNFIFILGFLGAAFTEYIGVHAVFGAFVVGIAIGDSVHLKERTREVIQQFVTNIFAPLFFVSIGLRVNYIANFNPLLVLVIVLLAVIGKVAGCGIGARLSGHSPNDSFAIGFGLNSRGAMEIILGILALQAGLINDQIFVALVTMALFTSIISGPFIKFFLGLAQHQTFRSLLKTDNIIELKSSDKNGAIKELIDVIALKNKINKNEVFNEVNKKEELNASGIANGLAIPHAKIKISHPMLAVGIHRTGLDFKSFDDAPSHVIVLLLTPYNKMELQLQLLSEIAGNFRDISLTEDIISMPIKEAMLLLKTKTA